MSWLQKQNQEREDYKNDDKYHHKESFFDLICTNATKEWIFVVIFALSVPVLVYFLVIDKGNYEELDEHTCLVQNSFRVPCGQYDITPQDCDKLSCCFDATSNQCYHYLPSKYSYTYNEDSDSYEAVQPKSPVGTKSVSKLQIYVNEKSEDTVSVILKESDDINEDNSVGEKNYLVKIDSGKLMIDVYRNDATTRLLSTSKGPLIASEKYWEWTIYLANTTLLGINQTFLNFENGANFTKVFYKNKNDHYSIPILWAHQNGTFHGVTIKHAGPLEITILPSSLVILRSLRGRRIEIELSVGPTPSLLHDQQANPFNLPPFWTLETYVCRRRNVLDLAELAEQLILDTENAQSNCLDDNLLTALVLDNSANTEIFTNFSLDWNQQGQKFILSMPPHIIVNTTLHEVAENLNILYKFNGTSYKGQYLNQVVVYPDYNNLNITEYMRQLNGYFSSYLNITIDGIVLNDNWPVDESYRMNGSDFPYFTKDLQEAMSYTLPWNSSSSDSVLHIQSHNSYGAYQMKAVKEYYNTTDYVPVIMSASKDQNQGDPSLIQNLDASWDNLRNQLTNVMFNSITGNHLVSLPVCGDTKAYNVTLHETLCIRWYLVAATMPIFHISSVQPWREPPNLNSKFAEQAAESAMRYREMLLPIYYTILSSKQPVVRPMFYNYYEDKSTLALEMQYMIGENILVAHPLTSDRQKLQIYLPRKHQIWYEVWEGKMYNATANPWINVTVRETDFLAFVAYGTVLPLKSDNTIDLVVALNCTAIPCTASSTLLLDSYVQFSANDSIITISNITYETCNYTLGNIKLYKHENNSGSTHLYDKNLQLCNETETVSIPYEEIDEGDMKYY